MNIRSYPFLFLITSQLSAILGAACKVIWLELAGFQSCEVSLYWQQAVNDIHNF